VTKELDGAGYVFWGGREGYQNLWNTNMKRELEHQWARVDARLRHEQHLKYRAFSRAARAEGRRKDRS